MKVLALIFFTFLSWMQLALAGDCLCPPSTSAKKSCGPIPAKYDKNYGKHPCQSRGFLEDLKQLVSTDKSPNETLSYIRCYSDSKESFCHYKRDLAAFIGLAAESSKLSPAVEACLVMRESQFKFNEVSNKDAHGYVQITSNTITDLNNIVLLNTQKLSEQLKAYPKEIMSLISKLNEKGLTQEQLVKRQGDLDSLVAEARRTRSQYFAKSVWDKYWHGGKAPSSISTQSTGCPQVAFALMAMKQTFDLYQMQDVNLKNYADGSFTVGDMNETDSAIFLAGAYNIGRIPFAKACAPKIPYRTLGTLQDCMNQFNPKSETYLHMKSIQSCALRFSDQPMNGDQQRNCKESACTF